MKTSKKILSVLLAVLMAFTAVPATFSAFASPADTKATYTPTYSGNATRGTYAGILQDANDMLAGAVFTGDTLATLWGMVPGAADVLPETATAAFYEAADPELFAGLSDYMESTGQTTVTADVLSGYFAEKNVTVTADEFAAHAERFIDAFITPETTASAAEALTGNFSAEELASFCTNLDLLCQSLGIAQPAGLQQILDNASAGVSGADYQLRVYLKNVLFFFVPDTAQGLMNMLRAIAEPANSAAFYEAVTGLMDDLDVVLEAIGGVTPEMQAQIDEIKGIINALPKEEIEVDGEQKTVFNYEQCIIYLLDNVILPAMGTNIKVGDLLKFGSGSSFVLPMIFDEFNGANLREADDAVDTLNVVLHYLSVNLKANKITVSVAMAVVGDKLSDDVKAIIKSFANDSEQDAVWNLYQQVHKMATDTVPTTPPEEPAATPSYTVTASAGANGIVAPASQSVISGRDTSLQVTANEGYVIDSLTVDGDAVAEAVGQSIYVLALEEITADTEVAVTFKSEQTEPETFTVAVSKTGEGTAAADKETVVSGETVVITITPAEGWQLEKVTVNGEDKTSAVSGGKLTVENITANTEVAVTFTEVPAKTFAVTVTAGANGTATPESATVVEGESVTVEITANDGYVIDQLTVNGETVADAAGLTDYALSFHDITENKNVNVTFKSAQTEPDPQTFDVTVSKTGEGTVKSDKETVVSGETAVITIIPAAGWQLEKVTVNGEDKTSAVSGGKLTVENITANTEVAVTFTESPRQQFAVTVTAGENGTATPESATVAEGESVTVEIAANDGYVIDRLTVNGTPVDAAAGQSEYSLTVTPTADTAVSVTFAAKEVKPLGIVVANKANVLSSASASSSVVTTLNRNQYAYIDGESGSFYKVSFTKGSADNWYYGYIKKDYLRSNDLPRDYTVTKSSDLAQIMVGEIIVRDTASASSAPVTVVSKGGYLYVNEVLGGWYKVSLTQTADAIEYEGYVRAQYVKIISDDPLVQKKLGVVVANQVNVLSSASASGSVKTTLNRNQYAYIDGESGDFYTVSFSKGNGWYYGYIKKDYLRSNDLPRDYTVTKSSDLAQIMVDEIIVRDTASASSAPVTVVPQGGYLYINEVLGGWYKVSLTQTADAIEYEGYVQAQYVKVISDDPAVQKQLAAVTAETANVYSSADTDSAVTTTLKSGQYAYIDGDAGEYYLVSFTKGSSWYYGYMLKADVELQNK